jgi:hypothetical protein
MDGLPPQEMISRIARRIVELHLASKLMWCILTMDIVFALREETARLGDGKIAINKIARKSTEWAGEIAGMVERACRGRNFFIASGADEEWTNE